MRAGVIMFPFVDRASSRFATAHSPSRRRRRARCVAPPPRARARGGDVGVDARGAFDDARRAFGDGARREPARPRPAGVVVSRLARRRAPRERVRGERDDGDAFVRVRRADARGR